ncbi:MAG: hypothetical protein H3Z52_07225 [archaeon]|nr:hypothetical protein [archaeon]MCP8315612.1 hypothetical protein [archaeon]MCP8320716.1 hypothetical protein [archaeon]
MEWIRDPYKYRVVEFIRRIGGEARFRDFKRNLKELDMSEKKLATTLKELCILSVLRIDWRDELDKKIKYYVLPGKLRNIDKEFSTIIEDANRLLKDAKISEREKVECLASLIGTLIQKMKNCMQEALKRSLNSKNYDEAIKKIAWSLLAIESWSFGVSKILWQNKGLSSIALNQAGSKLR